MKKLLLALSVVGFFSTAKAQMNLIITDSVGNVVTSSTLNYWIPCTGIDTRYWHITNPSGAPVTVKVKKTIVTLNDPGATAYFCTDANCYSPSQTMSLAVLLSASGGSSLLTTDFNPNSVAGVSTVRYTVINQANVSDTAFFIINYNASCSPAGILNQVVSKPTVSNPSPNPASTFCSMNFKMGNSNSENSKLVIYNMIGVRVSETRIEEVEGSVRLDVTNLEAGIYFCSLESDGKILSTKRLVVTH